MLPKAIRNLIEAYGMDMALCEELQKTKLNRQAIRNGDAEFCVGMITRMGFGFQSLYKATPEELGSRLYEMDFKGTLDLNKLLKIWWKTNVYWEKHTGGWCMKKLEEIFDKRCKIWNDIGINQYWGDRKLIGKWIAASKFMVVGQYFACEVSSFHDDQLIGP